VSRTTPPSTSTTPASTAATTTPLTAAQCAHTLVEAMSPAERAGQLLMVGLDANARRDSLDDLVPSRHLGGVILLGGWYGGADRARAVTHHLVSLTPHSEPGLFIAVDQEGGNVQQLRGAGLTRMPTARIQSQLSADQLAARAAGWATELRRAGINVNLAPVADTVPAALGRANEPIGHWDRQFSSDPDEVGRSVGAFVAGMHRGGVAATVKHFPGIGRITGNTDLTTQGITDRTTTSTDRYLRAFAAGIKAGADLVMVGSAIYSRIDPGVNAPFSTRIVTGLLRQDLGYDGVVITDDVGAAKAVSATPVGQRATRFVDAGGDIVLTARPATVPTMHDALVSRMSSSAPFAAKVEVSAERVITLKVKRGLATCR
jgi:beta-N-acetylhexosaminidase